MSAARQADLAGGRAHLLRPASLLLFVAIVLAVIAGVAWQYGWHGPLFFQETAADAQAHLESADLMLRSGQYTAARRQIAPVLREPDGPLYRQARLLQWRIDKTETLAIPADSPKREAALRSLRPQLAGLYAMGSWPLAQWQAFARDAYALGAYDLSAQAWLAAARADPHEREADQLAAAHAWAAGSQPAKAGALLLQLAAQSQDSARAKRWFLQGIRWIQGGKGAEAALQGAQSTLQRLPQLWQDHEVLLAMAELALSAGRPQLAAEWLRRELLRKAPGRKMS
ncbi:hypothetical protein [Acidithiobacillus sp. AMEEHan]|uniref:hypothetical protein n=1 Tax=Acidithiobacillus sp. AMEEHan TaxID=2994951 RepID=UPI0027E42F7B|nr:hypothetical protein [Acidithiobacillus sp. AMEEHan]